MSKSLIFLWNKLLTFIAYLVDDHPYIKYTFVISSGIGVILLCFVFIYRIINPHLPISNNEILSNLHINNVNELILERKFISYDLSTDVPKNISVEFISPQTVIFEVYSSSSSTQNKIIVYTIPEINN